MNIIVIGMVSALVMIALVVVLTVWAMRHAHKRVPALSVPATPPPSSGTGGTAKKTLDEYPLSQSDREYVEEWERRSPTYTKMYWALVGVIFTLLLVAGLAIIAQILLVDFSNLTKSDLWVQVASLAVYAAVYIAILAPTVKGCVKTVNQDEVGLLSVLSFPIKVCNPGPVIVLFEGRFMSLNNVSTQTNQKQYPAETTDITYAPGGVEAEGKKQLLRVTLLGPEGKKKDGDPWKQPRTIGIGFTLSLMPDTDHPFIFLRFTGSIDKAQGWASDIVLSKYIALLASHTPETMLRQMDEINKTLKKEVENVLNPRGVTVVRSELVLPDLGLKFNEGIQKKADATLAQAGELIVAETERQKKVLEAEGEKKAKELDYEATAGGYKKIVEALGVTGEQVLEAETTRKVAENVGELTVVNGAGTGNGARAFSFGNLFERGAEAARGGGKGRKSNAGKTGDV